MHCFDKTKEASGIPGGCAPTPPDAAACGSSIHRMVSLRTEAGWITRCATHPPLSHSIESDESRSCAQKANVFLELKVRVFRHQTQAEPLEQLKSHDIGRGVHCRRQLYRAPPSAQMHVLNVHIVIHRDERVLLQRPDRLRGEIHVFWCPGVEQKTDGKVPAFASYATLSIILVTKRPPGRHTRALMAHTTSSRAITRCASSALPTLCPHALLAHDLRPKSHRFPYLTVAVLDLMGSWSSFRQSQPPAVTFFLKPYTAAPIPSLTPVALTAHM
jgi:hypothetical protein